jgi:DDE superfamily endonuclease/Helix-turn-helix of DDE superfamily endonuclease
LSGQQLDTLAGAVYQHLGGWNPATGRPHRLTFYHALVLTLCYLRNNLPQAVLAEFFGCSQATVSRTISTLHPAIAAVLDRHARQIAFRELCSTTRVDGFIAYVGNHRHPDTQRRVCAGQGHLWSKRKAANGFNIQVVASHDGRLILTGKPMPASMHDAKAFRRSGLSRRLKPLLHHRGGPGVIADLAYVGTGILTGYRQRHDRPLSQSEKAFNQTLNRWRACVERAIAHLKNWKILTAYHGILNRFPALLTTITRLEIYRAW